MIKTKCLSFALLLGLSLTGLFTVFSNDVNASSAYDTNYRTIENLETNSNFASYYVCDGDPDFATNWTSYLSGDKPTAGSVNVSAMSSSWATALENGRWGISQTKLVNSSGTLNATSIFWTEDDSLILNWESSTNQVLAQGASSGVSPDIHFVSIVCQPGNNNLFVEGYFTQNTIVVSNNYAPDNDSGPVWNWFFNGNTNYPEGYAGPTIPDTGTVIGGDQYPKVIVKIDGLKIGAIYTRNLFCNDSDESCVDGTAWYNMKYTIKDSSGNVVGTPQTLSPLAPFEGSIPAVGEYKLIVQPIEKTGPTPPIPNYWKTSTYTISADGSTKVFTPGDIDCNDTGDCEVSSDNEVLNIFNGLDSINMFGLQSFIMAPIKFFGELPEMAENCSPISFPLFGSNISLPCMKSMYWDWNAAVMNMYTLIVNATVSYVIALNVFRHIKDINSPHKDSIEVARL